MLLGLPLFTVKDCVDPCAYKMIWTVKKESGLYRAILSPSLKKRSVCLENESYLFCLEDKNRGPLWMLEN